ITSCGKVGRCQRLFETPLQLSARGGLFYGLSPVGASARYERFLTLHVILIVPGTAGDFFVGKEELGGLERTTRERAQETVFAPLFFLRRTS
ncbi:hypothetical protein, partial [Desulfovibrio piger]|uniref:hypothetical protein n=1 Tax=Desulfovibrio piger TaxID=901 RepID=UPI003077B0A8